ncbi:CLUMA_CG009152, isoform A [Clunio marinus]|uniref:CLUMA_CG009152, isoform A n=1 Tax=Clunio marinus TaxID=568069 RepID=A0A1J1I9P7_9DIPT|nr:CLUMA_CG009152, isoform A [Clunio marinus]
MYSTDLRKQDRPRFISTRMKLVKREEMEKKSSLNNNACDIINHNKLEKNLFYSAAVTNHKENHVRVLKR